MRKKLPKTKGKPTLQTLVLVEITDPGEQAALEKRIRARITQALTR